MYAVLIDMLKAARSGWEGAPHSLIHLEAAEFPLDAARQSDISRPKTAHRDQQEGAGRKPLIHRPEVGGLRGARCRRRLGTRCARGIEFRLFCLEFSL